MRTVKAATVALLFVLIPSQAPSAEMVESSPSADETSAAPVLENGVKTERQPLAQAGAPAASELEESAEPESPEAKAADPHPESFIEIDGYSWSVRSLRG